MSTDPTPIRILHVDDEPAFTEMAATFLEREDERFTVETATGAAEGVDRLADDIDCVVSDYDMPSRNGIEFLEAVREEYPDLPFILYTGKGSEEVASDAISAGVTEYLQKGTDTSQYTVLAHRISNAVEQYRSRRAAEETERKLSQIAEKAEDILFMFDSDWSELLFINSAYEDVWGASISDLDADPQSFLDYVHPDDRELIAQNMERLSNGKPSETEFRVVRPDDDQRWVRAQTKPIFEDGEIARIVGFVRDITDRKARERELERYEAYLEESTDVITVIDESGVIEYQSPSVTRVLGYEPGELVGQNGFDFIHPDDLDEVSETFTDVVSAPGETLTAECRFRTADNEWCWLEIRGTNQLENDAIEGIVTNNRDITERKEREQALRREREVTQQALDTLTDMFYVFGQDGKLRRWNDRVVEVTGYSDAELAGMDALDFFPEDQQERIADIIDETLSTGTATAEADALTKDGQRIPYEFTGARLTDADGQLIGLVGIGRNISERKRRETELERKNERLEEFASVISHDLRNPLSVAEARLSLARDDHDSEHLDAVQRAHDRIRDLIEDVLTLAREGTPVEEVESVDLAETTDASWQNVATGDATLVVEADRTLRADRSRLRQLLENLFRNSVEHGGPGVTVRVGPLESGDGFYVADDGSGISPARREEVFESGYSTSEDGTGFGLSIVDEVVEAHGWQVDVTDSADGGARFEITGVTVVASDEAAGDLTSS